MDSVPPLIDQVAVSFAVNKWIPTEFSIIVLTLVVAPAAPLGPVIAGEVSSTSKTVTVTVWVDTFPAVSVDLTTTT